MNRSFSGRSDMPFALLLLAPSLLLLGGLVAWPMVSNIEISFLRLPLNPNIESTFIGVSNYVRILSDPGFWHSLWMTVWYTALVVAGSTVLGLAVAMFFQPRVPPAQNRAFAGDPFLRNAVYFAGVRLEIHVQQRLRHCELPRRRSSASL